MAPRQILAVALASAQILSGAALNLRGTEWGAETQEPVAVGPPQASFMERNLPYIMPIPYLEGKAVSLIRRMDLTVLFPNKAGGTPSNLVGVVPNTPMKAPAVPQNPKDIDHPVLDKDGKVKGQNAVLASIISSASTLILWVVAVLAAAFFYRNYKDISEVNTELAQKNFKGESFKHGPFDCFADMDVCCWSFWCGSVQWADSVGAVGILSFWVAFAIIVSLQFVNFLSGIGFWFLAAIVFTYFRQEMRRKMDLQNTNEDLAKDLAMWCCCQCCAIAQEARQVKEARALSAAS